MIRHADAIAAQFARDDANRAAYAAERCIAHGCREHGPFGINGRNFCREHLPADHWCSSKTTPRPEPVRVEARRPAQSQRSLL